MTVNYVQIRTKIREAARKARVEKENLQERLEKAREALQALANDLAILSQKVQEAKKSNPAIRCALPWQEALNATIDAPPMPSGGLLLAADGSQINPNHHDRIPFGLINIGLFRYDLSHTTPPQEVILSDLLTTLDLYDEHGFIGEERIALERDYRERQALLERIQEESVRPILTLTDGPLELYHQPRADEAFDQTFKAYLRVMAQLAQTGAVTAGYVEKPRADLLVRLLEIGLLPEERLDRAGEERPLVGLSDLLLFNDLLKPGQRSAIFGIQSTTAERFHNFGQGELALHFFYLNVGDAPHPRIARVEIPAWVAVQPQAVEQLHAVLLQQTAITPNRRYPYALTRAHELAVVTYRDKELVEAMLVQEWQAQGLGVGDESAKQSVKKDLVHA